MDEPRFWEILQRAHEESGGDMDEKCEIIAAVVSKLSREEAIAFSRHFDSTMDRAYSWALWGAAYVINGGCSDDTFSDFRASLISRGRQALESALSDPDSLAAEEFDDGIWFYEGYQYAVTDGVKAAIGSGVNRDKPHPKEPSGAKWSEDKAYEPYPKLTEKFA
jgi:hypothetical protein